MCLLAAAFLLAGCGAGDVVQTDQSTFQITAQEGLITGGWSAAQKEAIEKGNKYCAAKGQHFTLMQQSNGGVPGWTPLTSAITFTCGADIRAESMAADNQCAEAMRSSDLDPIRDKVELLRNDAEAPPPFAITSNDAFPTAPEHAAIAKWATIRDECIKRRFAIPSLPGANALQATEIQQDQSFPKEVAGRVNELVVALYASKLSYGEFAAKRYEIDRDGAAAERQFRAASLIADHERQVQAQQIAEQHFQSTLLAWSTYMQTVNARQPQTIRVEGTMRTNCLSQRIGGMVQTSCN